MNGLVCDSKGNMSGVKDNLLKRPRTGQMDKNCDQFWRRVLAGIVIWGEGTGDRAPKLAGKRKHYLGSSWEELCKYTATGLYFSQQKRMKVLTQ